ncbi:UDP-N-acetylmuramate:L-alanyl-gamma-D-glutamyl-meso-diaminopimelate ligase [Legionella spiritensis]|uniref:UDP-N-acetylmuramate:L-alanyl-gamma-D-glutamyl- meso-diaminopimelate ligase n=1 Tax=Legionella spiritensis TaxID=452 RepID=UPI000F6C24E4|nr:UDP-N-acetylmuramate:L-alanyl-gamma-D-glutamyl-meso-diaminopimelate ligase [Legionella spiritensis]VEG90559.1 UDP-N-acetylmuramate-L-alanyl-gamma-D-glutamyl-meso-diaminopimelate ligase [Legionella spiritensis]
MRLHILGIGGTFMSALAILAREAGFEVTGCDADCYPPVTDLLAEKDIIWQEGYDDASLALQADCVIVGNAVKRGMPVIEAVLNHNKRYISGPQWLADNILSRYRVIAVAGTHGKTTTTSMLAHIMEEAGLKPGFLIGGVAPNFGTSARLGEGEWFVIEADEYDSAFFDKRPKLMHYRPEITVLNNLEFDHADIYPNLEAIKQQFHFYLKTIPGRGIVLKPRDDKALNDVITRGIFSRLEEWALHGQADWRAEMLDDSCQSFQIWHHNEPVIKVKWPLIGQFNMENGMAAIAASVHAGIDVQTAAGALQGFSPVKRRLEVKSEQCGITIYDDFAHHPTAIAKTIEALKLSKRHRRIFAVLEFASYTMRSGFHADNMAQALVLADAAFILRPEQFNLDDPAGNRHVPYQLFPDTKSIIHHVAGIVKPGDAVLIMSNRGFDNIHQQLAVKIAERNIDSAR